jgi:hypothetical protein
MKGVIPTGDLHIPARGWHLQCLWNFYAFGKKSLTPRGDSRGADQEFGDFLQGLPTGLF